MFMKKKSFIRSSEGAIASYNYTDVQEGIGYQEFYGIKDFNANYALLPFTDWTYSSYVSTSGFESPKTITFATSPFNLPKVVKGTAFLRFGVGNNGSGSAKYNIRILNNSTAISTTVTIETGNNQEDMFVKIPMTQTSIKRGDIINLEIASVANGAAADKVVWHDPMNRNGTSNFTTQMRLLLPFRIDI